jgi:hypothetical protein
MHETGAGIEAQPTDVATKLVVSLCGNASSDHAVPSKEYDTFD